MARAHFFLLGWLLIGLAACSEKKEPPIVLHSREAQSGTVHIPLTQEQREALQVKTALPMLRLMQEKRTVFGTILPNQQHYAHVATQLSGMVRQVHKQRGDTVYAHEPLAVLESPELADAVSAYLAALHQRDVGQAQLVRQERLYQKQLIAENAWIEAVNQAKQQRMEVLFAEQKLCGLGLTAAQVAQLPNIPAEKWHQVVLYAPFDGVVLERDLVAGEWVSTQHPAFTIANLNTVWAELELPVVAMGSMALDTLMTLRDSLSGKEGQGRVIYMSPSLNRENMTVQVLAELDNRSKTWRLGSFVEAELATGEKEAPLTLPRTAIQRIEGQEVVFVEVDEGFIARPVEVGVTDTYFVEIVSGLSPEDRCAVDQTFVLKSHMVLQEEEAL